MDLTTPPSPSASMSDGSSADSGTIDVADLSFENAMTELEAIVARLERGEVALDQSISLYERGQALKARCDHLLRDAEARIEKITLNASNKPTGTTPLDPD